MSPDSPPTPAAPPARIPARGIFTLACASAVAWLASPQIGLAVGLALGLIGLAHWPAESKKLSRLLIQSCVVLLGFRMDLGHVARAGVPGLLFAAGTIAGTFALGELLRRTLVIPARISTLICSGTAICGGSAIAAVGAAIRATGPELAVATGTVFILNGIALFLFPWLGHQLALDATQFGTWAGVAIHDVSSVVGAARAFAANSHDPLDPHSASVETTAAIVKLSRVLWIVPIAAIAAMLASRSKGSDSHETESSAAAWSPTQILPWFIILFLLASLARTLLPSLATIEPQIRLLTAIGMSLALFLIGTGLTRSALAKVGWKPMLEAIVLWIAIAGAALLVVTRGGLADPATMTQREPARIAPSTR